VIERPFFIVGHPRSGTTLVRFMLASHPRLWIPDETGFIPFLRMPPQSPLDEAGVRRVARRVATLNREWRPAAEQLDAGALATAGASLGDLLDWLYRLRMRGSGAERWGDKTPLYVLHLSAIAAIFPSAQFIHVVRDGRDVALSVATKWGRRYPQRLYLDEVCTLQRWAEAVHRGRVAGAALGPGRYLEVRYESLVERGEECLREICRFLGEEYHVDMLRPERLAREIIPPEGHVEVRSPISAGRVGRWRRELPPFARVAAEQLVGQLLAELGYELDPGPPPTAVDRARLAGARARCRALRGLRAALATVAGPRLNRAKRARRRGRA